MARLDQEPDPKPDQELDKLDARHVWHPFTRKGRDDKALLIASGSRAILRTSDGREIVDAISSWWVNLFGHGQPDIAGAIARQASELEQVIFAGYTHEPAIRLAEALCAIAPPGLQKVFFSDDGSTAVEVALKLAWQYWQVNDEPDRQRIVVFEGGYHGDTIGAMSAGNSSGFFEAWRRQLVPCDVLPWPATWDDDPDADARERDALDQLDLFLSQHGRQTAAMLVEPLVQGASGMRFVRPTFIAKVVRRVRQAGALVIFDEIMTGFGRTGTCFALEQTGVAPDMLCLSKGLTGGFLPMSVTLVHNQVFDAFHRDESPVMFAHGHSYTANPLGCAAALASLKLLQQASTAEAWQRIEAGHRAGMRSLDGLPAVSRRRVRGTIAALDLAANDAGYHSAIGQRLAIWFRERHRQPRSALLRPLGNVVYVLPPYCISDEQLAFVYSELATALQEIC
jgi:adenosylmethionine---8-amino-7-oxononanoate aminotransferase